MFSGISDQTLDVLARVSTHQSVEFARLEADTGYCEPCGCAALSERGDTLLGGDML